MIFSRDKLETSLSFYFVGLSSNNELYLLLAYDNRKHFELINLTTGDSKTKAYYKKTVYLANYEIYSNSITDGGRSVSVAFMDDCFYVANLRIDLDLNQTPDSSTFPSYTDQTEKNDNSWISKNRTKIEPYTSSHSSIVNLKSIEISADNTIIINNKHEFKIIDGIATIDLCGQKEISKRASCYEKNKHFRFENGVAITIHYNIMTIKLKDVYNIQRIHIPLVIGGQLAIALNDEVSGNQYHNATSDLTTKIDPQIVKILSDPNTWD